jgi:hypothetical protein
MSLLSKRGFQSQVSILSGSGSIKWRGWENELMASRAAVAGLFAIALSACGQSGGNQSAPSGGTPAATSGWIASDACATLDKNAIASLLKSEVTTTDPGAITDHEGAGTGGTSSQCSYMLADGRNVIIQTLQPATDPGVPAMVAAIHKELKASGDDSAQDIGGAGKATIWAERSRIMYAVYGGGRYASVAVRKIMPGGSEPTVDQIKADELALLHAIAS